MNTPARKTVILARKAAALVAAVLPVAFSCAGCGGEMAAPAPPAAPELFTYLPLQEWTAPIPAPMEVFAADFDGDGREDLTWNHKNGDANQSYFGFAMATGAFKFNRPSRHGTADLDGWETFRTLIGHFLGPAIADQAWNHLRSHNRVYFGLSDGAGHIDYMRSQERLEFSWYGFTAVVLDINGDGRDDMAWSEPATTGNRIFVGIDNIDGILDMLAGAQEFSGDWAGFQVVAADANGDGRGDLIWNALAPGANRIVVGSGRPDGRFDLASEVRRGDGEDWFGFALHVGDVDGDGKDDLVWERASGGQVRLYVSLSAGDGSFAALPAEDVPLQVRSPLVVRLGDFDGDGRSDLVWNELGAANRIQVGLGEASGRFGFAAAVQEHPEAPASADWSSFQLLVADVDGNGHDDLIWNRPESTNIIAVALSRPATP